MQPWGSVNNRFQSEQVSTHSKLTKIRACHEQKLSISTNSAVLTPLSNSAYKHDTFQFKSIKCTLTTSLEHRDHGLKSGSVLTY